MTRRSRSFRLRLKHPPDTGKVGPLSPVKGNMACCNCTQGLRPQRGHDGRRGSHRAVSAAPFENLRSKVEDIDASD